MKVTIRLYKRFDLDLISLYCAETNFNFKEEFKKSLISYIRDEPCKYKISKDKCDATIILPSKICFHIDLEEEKEKDIIEWIQNITVGRRNSLIKNIFRYCLEKPVISPYFNGSENKDFIL